jgi:deoxyribonuclease-4
MHVHFSHIEYGKSGEIKHLTLEDEVFGPDFAPLAQVFAERAMRPVVICESKDVMAEDALQLKAIYEKALLIPASL